MPKPASERKRRRAYRPPGPDPRPAAQILAEEVLLTKAMLAKVFGYRHVRTVERLVEDDCASEDPCLRPVYIRIPYKRRGQSGVLFPKDFPSLKSARWRAEDVRRYLAKMQRDFPEDLEWKGERKADRPSGA